MLYMTLLDDDESGNMRGRLSRNELQRLIHTRTAVYKPTRITMVTIRDVPPGPGQALLVYAGF